MNEELEPHEEEKHDSAPILCAIGLMAMFTLGIIIAATVYYFVP